MGTRPRRTARATRHIALSAAAAAALAALRAHAVTSTWQGPGAGVFSGDFNVNAHWDLGVPGATDTAHFDLGEVYTVTFGASATNAALLVDAPAPTARVTFDSAGTARTYTVTGDATFSGGAATLDALDLDVGDTLTVNGGALLTASNGSTLSATRLIAGNNTGDGAVVVTGAASRLNLSGTAAAHALGRMGNHGNLLLQNAASGTIAGSLGIVEAVVPGTTATLQVTSGARLDLGSVAITPVGAADQLGALLVSGADSVVTQSGAATLLLGNATAVASSGALLQVDAGATFTTGTGGTTVLKEGRVLIDNANFIARGDITVDNGAFHQTLGTPGLLLETGTTFTASNGAGVTLNALTLTGAHLVADGPGTTVEFTQNLVIAGQNLALPGSVTVRNGASAAATAQLGAPSVTVGGTNVAGQGRLTVESGATFTAQDVAVGTSGASINSGILTVTGPGSQFVQTTNAGTSLVVGAAGSSTGTVRVQDQAFFRSGDGQVLVNPTGAIDVDAGHFVASGNVMVLGTFTVTNGGSLNLAPATNLTIPAGGGVTLGGQYAAPLTLVTGGTLAIAATNAAESTFVVSAGTLSASVPFAPASLIVSGGTVTGPEDITSNKIIQWSGGTIDGSGSVNATVGIFISGTNTKRLLGTRVLRTPAVAGWTQGDIQIGTTAAIVNGPGSFDVSGDGSILGGNFINTGVFRKSAGAPTTVTARFNNNGTVLVNAAALALNGGGTHTGRFTGSAGTTLRFGGGDHHLTPASDLAAHTLAVNLGTLTVSGRVTATASFSVGTATVFAQPGARLNLASAALALAPEGVLHLNTGTTVTAASLLTDGDAILDGGDDLVVTGHTTWNAGTLGGSGTAHFNGGATLAGVGPLRTLAGTRTLNLRGASTWSAGALSVSTGATLNLADGTLDITAPVLLLGGTFNNTAHLHKSADTNTATLAPAAFNNAGTVTVSAGTLALAGGGGTHSGHFTGSPGATLSLTGGATHTFLPASAVSGSNTVLLEDGQRFFNGAYDTFATRVTAGTAEFTTSPATQVLEMTGGTIRLMPSAAPGGVVLRTTQFSATGAAVLDLNNNAMIVDYPAAGGTAVATVRSAIVDRFIRSTTADADATKAIGYAEASEVFGLTGTNTATFLGQPVDATAALARFTLLGDANLDGAVNFNDLVNLAQNYGATVSATTEGWWFRGDFTHDGVVDFNDLVKLAQNYNAALPADVPFATAAFEADLARAFAAVPEPAALPLAAMAACGLAGRRRRRR